MPPELLQQMHDISGLDAISNWPLAIGWWLIAGIVILLITGTTFFYIRHKKYRASWLYFIYKNLTTLENSIDTESKKHIITELSEYLRQIAIKKHPREDCASLIGAAWLTWLKEHDPKQFNWVQHGAILVLGPYAPDLQNIDNAELKTLIQAAKRWVQ